MGGWVRIDFAATRGEPRAAAVLAAALAAAIPTTAFAAEGAAPGSPRRAVIAYSSYAYQGAPSTDILLLAKSIRNFGGGLGDSPVWILLPEGGSLPQGTLDEAAALGVEVKHYVADRASAYYPFASKAFAAAEAETLAEGAAAQLIWFDRDSIVLRDIGALLLEPGMSLGYRPVNAANIGQGAEERPDPFWARAYELGRADPAEAGRTAAYMDGAELRFYMAAGLVAVRPERGLLRRWAELVAAFAADREIAALCKASQSRQIFMHQAALSVAVAALIPPRERKEYGPEAMYPLNFWASDSPGRRPPRIDDALTLRYDRSLEGEEWRWFPMGDPFRAWLEERIR